MSFPWRGKRRVCVFSEGRKKEDESFLRRGEEGEYGFVSGERKEESISFLRRKDGGEYSFLRRKEVGEY